MTLSVLLAEHGAPVKLAQPDPIGTVRTLHDVEHPNPVRAGTLIRIIDVPGGSSKVIYATIVATGFRVQLPPSAVPR